MLCGRYISTFLLSAEEQSLKGNCRLKFPLKVYHLTENSQSTLKHSSDAPDVSINTHRVACRHLNSFMVEMNMYQRPAEAAVGGAMYSQCWAGMGATTDASWVSLPQAAKEEEEEARWEKEARKTKVTKSERISNNQRRLISCTSVLYQVSAWLLFKNTSICVNGWI